MVLKTNSKRLKKSYEGIDRHKIYSLSDAIKFIKGIATAKFDETIELVINLNVDAQKADQQLRGSIQLPNGIGKTLRVAVFAKGEKAEEAKKAGADVIGSDELADKISKGDINFDRCIATPDMMGMVGKLGKILGPKGLMPNPKLGTVTNDVSNTVKAVKDGQVEYRTDKTGIVHAGVGKASFKDGLLEENIKVFISTIVDAKPKDIKGTYIKSIFLSPTMGPSVKVNLADALNV